MERGSVADNAAQVPERVKQRIFRVPVDQGIPEGWKFVQLLGQETNLAFGASANFTADVVLCEVDDGNA